jgi:PPP family 3-phenylpropionic acid transporter
MAVAALPYWRLSSFYLFYFALLGSTAPFLALYFDHLGFSPRASASWWRSPC